MTGKYSLLEDPPQKQKKQAIYITIRTASPKNSAIIHLSIFLSHIARGVKLNTCLVFCKIFNDKFSDPTNSLVPEQYNYYTRFIFISNEIMETLSTCDQ